MIKGAGYKPYHSLFHEAPVPEGLRLPLLKMCNKDVQGITYVQPPVGCHTEAVHAVLPQHLLQVSKPRTCPGKSQPEIIILRTVERPILRKAPDLRGNAASDDRSRREKAVPVEEQVFIRGLPGQTVIEEAFSSARADFLLAVA